MRQEWRIREPGRDVTIVSRFDASPEERASAMAAERAAFHLDDWFPARVGDEALGRPRLVQLLRVVHPAGVGAVTWNNDWIRARIREAFIDGRLVAVPRALPIGVGVGLTAVAPAEPPPPPAQEEITEKTWIELELVDLEGKPVPSRKYLVVLDGGVERTGTLDRNGYARIDHLEPGTCKVSFPDIDGREWKPE